MRKPILLIILLISLILVSGCIKLNISTGIDEHNTAFLSYNIEMDLDGFDRRYQERLKNALNRIGWHYQEEYGFSVELDIESNPSRLVMTKRILNDSFEQAFIALESLVKNENITPFMQVDMAFSKNERQNRYIFNAKTDIAKIMSLSNAGDLPPSLLTQLEDALDKGEGSLTVSFPTSETVNSSHNINMIYHQVYMEAPLNFSGETNVELGGVLNLLADGTLGGTINEITHDMMRFRILSIIISCAVIVFLVIIILARSISRRNRMKDFRQSKY